MPDCLFCKFVRGEIAPDTVYEDDEVLAFNDISPQAPRHVLIIPKKHITSLNHLDVEDEVLMGKLYRVAKQVAMDQGIADAGYRCVINCGADGGQSVFHIHLHLMGGRPMAWPPG